MDLADADLRQFEECLIDHRSDSGIVLKVEDDFRRNMTEKTWISEVRRCTSECCAYDPLMLAST